MAYALGRRLLFGPSRPRSQTPTCGALSECRSFCGDFAQTHRGGRLVVSRCCTICSQRTTRCPMAISDPPQLPFGGQASLGSRLGSEAEMWLGHEPAPLIAEAGRLLERRDDSPSSASSRQVKYCSRCCSPGERPDPDEGAWYQHGAKVSRAGPLSARVLTEVTVPVGHVRWRRPCAQAEKHER